MMDPTKQRQKITAKRKDALQWLYDQGDATKDQFLDRVGRCMFMLMADDSQITATAHEGGYYTWSLTDKGRRDLHDG